MIDPLAPRIIKTIPVSLERLAVENEDAVLKLLAEWQRLEREKNEVSKEH